MTNITKTGANDSTSPALQESDDMAWVTNPKTFLTSVFQACNLHDIPSREKSRQLAAAADYYRQVADEEESGTDT